MKKLFLALFAILLISPMASAINSNKGKPLFNEVFEPDISLSLVVDHNLSSMDVVTVNFNTTYLNIEGVQSVKSIEVKSNMLDDANHLLFTEILKFLPKKENLQLKDYNLFNIEVYNSNTHISRLYYNKVLIGDYHQFIYYDIELNKPSKVSLYFEPYSLWLV